MSAKAYLEITMVINENNRPAAAKVYTDYKEPFLKEIKGAVSKNLLIRDEDVQVLHGFDSIDSAKAYLESDMFKNDVALGLSPLWNKEPSIKIYEVIA
ncbi:MAG: hypothetical protein KIC80_03990 [Brachyspira sp.]|jgi:hypothetical protein fulcA4_09828|nr:hypothetical protein [Brachyspira sp.]